MTATIAQTDGWDGEMASLIRAHNWTDTPVGPMEHWSRSLQTTLGILLNSRHPMFLWWGPELVQFYNDGYRPSLGADRHPGALGARGRVFWSEIWPTIGHEIEGVMQHGQATWHDDQLVPIFRNGRFEEVYWTYGYSPVRDDDGTVGGTLVVVQEQTSRVVGERRLRTLRDLGGLAAASDTEGRVWTEAATALAANAYDTPWSAFYVHGAGGTPRLVAGSHAQQDPDLLRLIARVLDTGESLIVRDAAERFATIVGPCWPEPIQTTFLVPIRLGDRPQPYAVFVAGASPRLPWDSGYQDFFELAAWQVALALATVHEREDERRRAAALAELNRAKTDFFSGVSHEFRTPLTLMLGATDEALRSSHQALGGDSLRLVHRNGLRLLKLVTTLLEFSRIEAGRAGALFEPVDLAALTRDLCGAFRSTIERAGLEFVVDCATIQEPIYVDRNMWERIVLNLISNAFKFTLSGSISVSLVVEASEVQLLVRDTGVGIPQQELARVFERFHRVRAAEARTHEGSGIGLALVRELVGMHSGHCRVVSTVGRGSTFTIAVPRGTAHLNGNRIAASRDVTPTPSTVDAYVQETLDWIVDAGEDVASDRPSASESLAGAAHLRVLIVDDNRDMREYLYHLLSARWRSEVAPNGHEALVAARRHPPDLVVADVMMPGIDGFELLKLLRADERTSSVPIMLLTARAGEEAQIDGWTAGADDYLVKPFSARELVARVDAQLRKSQKRLLESAVHRRLDDILAHAPVGIAILRAPDHIYDFANPAYLDLLGGRPVIGKAVREALPELDGQGIYEMLDRAFTSGEPHVGRAVSVSINRGPGGAPEHMYVDFVCQPLLNPEQQVESLCVVAFEVTELARARRDAETAHRMAELALETGRLGSWRIDLRTLERWNSPRCLANFGLPLDASLSFEDVIRAQHPDDRERVQRSMAAAIESHTDYICEYRVFWPDGSCHWLSVRGRTMYSEDGTPLYMAGNTLDVTEQRQLVEDLREARDELERRVGERTAELAQSNARLARALAERTALEEARSGWLRTLVKAQEEERRRVARELHDEMGQHLLALTIGLDALDARPEEVSISRLQAIVSRIDRSVHRLARDLRPAALDDLGLVAAVKAYVEEWCRQTEITGHVSSRNCDGRLPAHVESALYRIVQEALTNIARHAQAHHASVVIERRSDDVLIVVEDDGIGFDACARPGNDGGRYGLVGMRERAVLLGGSFTVESAEQGTSVFITIPIEGTSGHG